jgi:hypothetical protein
MSFPDVKDPVLLVTSGGTSRRSLLKAFAACGVLVAGGGVLSACSRSGSEGGKAADVELKVGGDWPYATMPTKAAQRENPANAAYGEALKSWLDKNPGVKLSNVNLDVWDQEALTTAVTGGTAPAMYPGNVLGGWGSAATRSAFQQGLAADVTELADTYAFADKLADYAKPTWANSKVDGRFYAAPQGYSAGNGIYFRRDLIRQLGLEEPTPGWTWADLRSLAKGLTEGKRKGLAIQNWGLGWALNAEAFNLLTQIPAPDAQWNWRWDYTSAADRWAPIVRSYRDMIYVDQSVLADVSTTDQEVTEAFSQGRAAIMPNNTYFFTGDPDADNTPANLAKKMDKEVGEVYGWIQHPRGTTGFFGATSAFMTLLSFNPDLSEEALDKAVDLHDYMTFGAGYVRQKKAAWELGKDLKKVYTEATPLRGMDPVEGVPGSLEDSWGTEFVQAVQEAAQLPTLPDQGVSFPAEESPGPEATAIGDAQSRWQFERADPDIAADLAKAERTRNKQAESFTSSTSDEEFVAAARRYYAAHQEFWRQHAPEFSEATFQGWYDDTIVPALG